MAYSPSTTTNSTNVKAMFIGVAFALYDRCMPDQLTFQFPYSPAEHAHARSEAGLVRGPLAHAGLAALLILPATIWQKVKRPEVPLLVLAVPALIMAAAFLATGPLLRRRDARRLRRENDTEIGKLQIFTFSRDGFTPSERWAKPVRWSEVDKVIETKRFLLICATSEGPFFVPRHAISSNDAERLRAFLEREFQSRPGKYKSLPIR